MKEKQISMDKPLVSIVIPVYNGYNFLEEAIQSALNQRYENVEIIVVNDGSTDNTKDICLKYGDKIRYFEKENGGVSTALNMAISKMKGQYFSWLSHDDLYHPEKLYLQIEQLRKFNFDENYFCGTNGNLINISGDVIRKNKSGNVRLYSDLEAYRLIHKKTFNGCGLLIPRQKLLDVNGFDQRYKFMQDRICWINIINEKTNYIYIQKDLVSTRIHENQQTIKIAHRLDSEIELYLNEAILDPTVNESDYKINVLAIHSIKRGKWNKYRHLLKKYDIKINLFLRIKATFLRVYYSFIRVAKKYYWKIKRRQ
jgi:hypothetical protein